MLQKQSNSCFIPWRKASTLNKRCDSNWYLKRCRIAIADLQLEMKNSTSCSAFPSASQQCCSLVACFHTSDCQGPWHRNSHGKWNNTCSSQCIQLPHYPKLCLEHIWTIARLSLPTEQWKDGFTEKMSVVFGILPYSNGSCLHWRSMLLALSRN